MSIFKRGVFWYQYDAETGELLTKTRYRPNTLAVGQRMPTVAQAVAMLDDDNNAHWTKAGLPAMAAVEEIVKNANITRRDVTLANPRKRSGYDA